MVKPLTVFLLPVFPEQPRTGGEIYNRQVIDRLRQQGLNIRVIALDSLVAKEKLHQQTAAVEIRQAISRQLDKLAEENKLQPALRLSVVYDSWLYRFLWPVMLIERLKSRFRLISFSQLCYWDTYQSPFYRLWHRFLTILALAPAHRRIGVSRALLTADLGPFASSKHDLVIYPGCDYCDSALVQADCNRSPAQIISVGNYTPRKGFHVLIEALALAFRQKPELKTKVSLRLVGNRAFNADYLKKLEGMITSYQLESAVILDDWKSRQEISQLFSDSQLFAFASESEGFGMVVLESMLHGLPVLLGDFMTAEELAGNGLQSGYVVDRKSPEAFAGAIISYFSADGRSNMGQAARQRALEISCSWEAVSEKFATLFAGQSKQSRFNQD